MALRVLLEGSQTLFLSGYCVPQLEGMESYKYYVGDDNSAENDDGGLLTPPDLDGELAVAAEALLEDAPTEAAAAASSSEVAPALAASAEELAADDVGEAIEAAVAAEPAPAEEAAGDALGAAVAAEPAPAEEAAAPGDAERLKALQAKRLKALRASLDALRADKNTCDKAAEKFLLGRIKDVAAKARVSNDPGCSVSPCF